MFKTTLTILQFLFVTILSAQHNIRIKIDSLPPESKTYDLFIAGTFNGWNPGNEKYQFISTGTGEFYIDLNLDAGTYEYKITRGNWKETECKTDGTEKENRLLKVNIDDSLSIRIEEWKDNFPDNVKKHSVSLNVKIIDTAFWIPQLNRTRRVWVYLPESYANEEKKYRFPVIYMHDGQNVFDDATSYTGEWGVDEFFDSTGLQQFIIIAIDNASDKRMNEYNPYDNERFGKGEGDCYVDFIVKTLKPFIDKNYRTLTDRKNTNIAGSSMGALISMYALLKYPKVFGGAGIFSPSFWLTPEIFQDIKKKGKKVKANIYFYAGKQEDETMVPNMLKAFKNMVSVSKSKIEVSIKDSGKHNEESWRKILPQFFSWIRHGYAITGMEP